MCGPPLGMTKAYESMHETQIGMHYGLIFNYDMRHRRDG